MFAFQAFGVTPDIVAIAKPIAAGVPLGAFIVREGRISVCDFGRTARNHFWGWSVSLPCGLEYLAIVEDEKLLENVARVGRYLEPATAVDWSTNTRQHRSPRAGIYPGPAARNPRKAVRGTGFGRRGSV